MCQLFHKILPPSWWAIFCRTWEFAHFFTWNFHTPQVSQLFYNYHLTSSTKSYSFEFYFVSSFMSGNERWNPVPYNMVPKFFVHEILLKGIQRRTAFILFSSFRPKLVSENKVSLVVNYLYLLRCCYLELPWNTDCRISGLWATTKIKIDQLFIPVPNL